VSYLSVSSVANTRKEWEWIPLRRLARIRRETNSDSSSVLLALSSDRGVVPRADGGGRQLPSESTVEGYWRVYPDDLVFNPMWAIGGGVAVSRIKGAVSTAYRIYAPGPRIWPRFLHYWLRSEPAINQYKLMVRGITTFDRSVGREDLEGMPVPTPDITIQRALVDYLDSETARIDSLIAAKQRMVELLAERLDGMTEQLLNRGGGARPANLGQFLSTKITDGPHETPEFLDYGVPFISIEAIVDDRIAMDRCRFISEVAHREYSKKCSPRIGDVLLAKTGATIGKTAIVDVPGPFSIWSPLALLRPRKQAIRSEYLWFFLRSRPTQRLIRELATQSTQPNIAMGDIAALPISVPVLQEQDIIVRQLRGHSEAVHKGTTMLHRQISLIQEHRQALITAAVTGQLDIAETA
jgi:type I restriction enzyme, S subunit